ncbi:class I SAM-dependent DNA methyltransferase [Polynucleobacter sp. MWH-P3-07-1]|uniref:class I SAM-dependent DNA methyltransferase n=1 Tax=Polynucleobacter sp. MWH-P3-07-1 TaxID=1743173 RepID=UPI001BFD5D84|nr:DNA methyltransferase [Polynucleobacter sp. MWH-P3-07-1]QWD83917.1 class I SAM-dependent DNA methyltransferase [Polynucleobacter sp. MWH-P3-07-1]
MPDITINEIRRRLQLFAKEHATDSDEKQHAQQFWRDFYTCFGLSKSSASMFEARVLKVGGARGYIDSFIPGVLLVEQKSLGRNLDDAYVQAQAYFHAIANEFEKPQYIITCDFQNFQLYDLQNNAKEPLTCKLDELHKRADWFMFLVDKRVHAVSEELPVNRKAAEQIAKLHDALLKANYKGKDLESFLTRLLFCLFADDTGIFGEDGIFRRLVEATKEDGSDLGSSIGLLFQVLNTPKDKRQTNLDEALQAFEYVNGSLFAENIQTPYFDFDLRSILLKCVQIDWSGISPAIFGAMFQAVLEEGASDTAHRKESRRELGAHYTSERNILKVIQPLFLDELHEEFNKAKGNKTKLTTLYDKLPTLKFFDPACGCGNFLVIAYREIRRIENDVINELFFKGQAQGGLLDIATLCRVNIGQFYGIEIDEAATHIARVALYITDHQLNLEAANKFGKTRATVPLVTTPHIHCDNALRKDWEDVVKAEDCSYIFGNPPFIGAALKSKEQQADMKLLFDSVDNYGKLDYVCAWYLIASKYITKNTNVVVAFVSTNSIVQGEQPPILWKPLLANHIKIKFAHRTFKWTNEARASAVVQCVIVGFGKQDWPYCIVYDYKDGVETEPTEIKAKQINAYLVDAENLLIEKRSSALCPGLPELVRGSIPYDDGNFLLSEDEKNEIIRREPNASKFIKKYGGAKEMLTNDWRYCIWLKDATPSEILSLPIIKDKVERVRKYRQESATASINSKKDVPSLFGDIRQPNADYLLIPRHSSENRKFLPIAYVSKDVICADSAYALPNASLYHFGVLNSSMHNSWMRAIAGRLESRYRYSSNIVYNNFIWVTDLNDEDKSEIERCSQNILDIRNGLAGTNVGDAYKTIVMPVELIKAHRELDKAVDKAYGYKGADDDASRVAFLFKKYEELTSLLPSTTLKKKRIKKSDDAQANLI